MCLIFFQKKSMSSYVSQYGLNATIGSFLLSLATADELSQYNGQGRNKRNCRVIKKGFSIHFPCIYKAMQGQHIFSINYINVSIKFV